MKCRYDGYTYVYTAYILVKYNPTKNLMNSAMCKAFLFIYLM